MLIGLYFVSSNALLYINNENNEKKGHHSPAAFFCIVIFLLLKFFGFSWEQGVVKINKAMKVKMCIDLLALLRYANEFMIQEKKNCRGNCFFYTFMNISKEIKKDIEEIK